MATGKNSLDQIAKNMDSWLTGKSPFALPNLSRPLTPSPSAGPKSLGLIILEHESTNQTVKAFTDAFQKVRSNGWRDESLARLFGSVYQNVDSNGVVTLRNIVNDNGPVEVSNSTTTTSPASSTGSSRTSSSRAPMSCVLSLFSHVSFS